MESTSATRTERREAICEAVFELLGEVGYDRMTMDAVAARARASKATIYRAWPRKPDLVVAAIMYRFGGSSTPPDTGSLRGDLLAHLQGVCTIADSADGDVMSGLLTAAARNPELSQAMNLCMFQTKRAAYEAMLARAVARGEVAPGSDAGLLHEIVHGMVTARRTWEVGPLDDAFVERLVDRVLLPVLRGSSA